MIRKVIANRDELIRAICSGHFSHLLSGRFGHATIPQNSVENIFFVATHDEQLCGANDGGFCLIFFSALAVQLESWTVSDVHISVIVAAHCELQSEENLERHIDPSV